MHDSRETGPWGFSVHTAKTLVNFDMQLTPPEGGAMKPVPRCKGNLFPWCGLRFNTNTCEVLSSYERYAKNPVAETVTAESRRPGNTLLEKMKRFISPKCHALLLDDVINSYDTVLLNIFQMFLVCAAKTAALALRLPHGPSSNPSLIADGVMETISYTYSLVQSRSNRRRGGFGVKKNVHCSCKVRRSDVVWLGLYAFREILVANSHQGFAPALHKIEVSLHQAGAASSGRNPREQRDGGDAEERSNGADIHRGARNGVWGQETAYPPRLWRVVQTDDSRALLQTLVSVGASSSAVTE
ncbi:unnamed protein product [Discosporangium mesarthrocarpum]